LGAKGLRRLAPAGGLEQARMPDDKPNVFNPDPMTLGDIASLYQILGNGGVHRKLKIIQSIPIPHRPGPLRRHQARPQRARTTMLNSLDDAQMTLTLQNALRSGSARTLTRDYGLKSAVAGMPGYSDGYRDAWFVGYTPKLLAGVWVGYDDSRPIGGKDAAVRSAVPLWGEGHAAGEARVRPAAPFPFRPRFTKVEIDRSTGALRGLAGLAPAPGDIFVYLKKDQVDAAGSTAAGFPANPAPREWSDWLTTMFNEADETGLAPDQVMEEDKRSNLIPALAEYKMPGCAATSFPRTERSTPPPAPRKTWSSAGPPPMKPRPMTIS
jgi:membrane peptidoglycan carboxypeptidase